MIKAAICSSWLTLLTSRASPLNVDYFSSVVVLLSSLRKISTLFHCILLSGTTNRKWSISSFMIYFSEFVFHVVLHTSLSAYVFMGLCLQVKFCHCFQVTLLSLKLRSLYLFLHPAVYVSRPQIILSEDKYSSIQSIQNLYKFLFFPSQPTFFNYAINNTSPETRFQRIQLLCRKRSAYKRMECTQALPREL